MTGPTSRRGFVTAIALFPLTGGAVLASPPAPSSLAVACDFAIRHRAYINNTAGRESWDHERLDAECDEVAAVYTRAITEPSQGLADLQAKARLLLDELEEPGNEAEYDDERLIRVILREVLAL